MWKKVSKNWNFVHRENAYWWFLQVSSAKWTQTLFPANEQQKFQKYWTFSIKNSTNKILTKTQFKHFMNDIVCPITAICSSHQGVEVSSCESKFPTFQHFMRCSSKDWKFIKVRSTKVAISREWLFPRTIHNTLTWWKIIFLCLNRCK